MEQGLTALPFGEIDGEEFYDFTNVRPESVQDENGNRRIIWPSTSLFVASSPEFAHDIVILLDPAEIVPDIHAAYQHPYFRDKAYAVLMSGPSGSADIGGNTVHPAQGVMTLTVIYWPRKSDN